MVKPLKVQGGVLDNQAVHQLEKMMAHAQAHRKLMFPID